MTTAKIDDAMRAAAFERSSLGGNLQGWRKDLPDGSFLLITYEGGYLYGPPADPHWIVGHYKGDDDGTDLGCIEEIDMDSALAEAAIMEMGGEPRSMVLR